MMIGILARWDTSRDDMMVDYRKYPGGKDGNNQPGVELNGEYYENLDIVIALAKALIKKGTITKNNIITEL